MRFHWAISRKEDSYANVSPHMSCKTCIFLRYTRNDIQWRSAFRIVVDKPASHRVFDLHYKFCSFIRHPTGWHNRLHKQRPTYERTGIIVQRWLYALRLLPARVNQKSRIICKGVPCLSCCLTAFKGSLYGKRAGKRSCHYDQLGWKDSTKLRLTRGNQRQDCKGLA